MIAVLTDTFLENSYLMHVDSNTQIILETIYMSSSLCRMRESNRKNNVFAQFRKTDRDRQKLIDTVIKQLRNLIAQHHA